MYSIILVFFYKKHLLPKYILQYRLGQGRGVQTVDLDLNGIAENNLLGLQQRTRNSNLYAGIEKLQK